MTEPNLDEQIEPIKPKFLDLVENHWASEENPHRIGIFIRKGNRTGRLNPGQFLAFTDGKGGFWEIGNRKGHKMVIIGNLIANQVREARIDEIKMLQTQATGYGSDPSYTKYPFYVIEQHAINDRIKELGE